MTVTIQPRRGQTRADLAADIRAAAGPDTQIRSTSGGFVVDDLTAHRYLAAHLGLADSTAAAAAAAEQPSRPRSSRARSSGTRTADTSPADDASPADDTPAPRRRRRSSKATDTATASERKSS